MLKDKNRDTPTHIQYYLLPSIMASQIPSWSDKTLRYTWLLIDIWYGKVYEKNMMGEEMWADFEI